jgi:hypothetical protein
MDLKQKSAGPATTQFVNLTGNRFKITDISHEQYNCLEPNVADELNILLNNIISESDNYKGKLQENVFIGMDEPS